MDNFSSFLAQLGPIGDSLGSMVEQFLSFLPNLIGALLILLLGWIIAKALRGVTKRVLTAVGADKFFEKVQLTDMLAKGGITASVSTILSKLVYWVVYLVFLTTGLQTLGLDVVTDAMYSLLGVVPNIIAAALILIIAGLVARFVSTLVENAAEGAGLTYGRLLGKLASAFILVFMGIMALSTLGIDTAVLTSNLTLVIGGVVVAAALAGGLGGREVVGNMLAANQLKGRMEKGQRVTMDDLSGVVESISGTGVTLKTDAGLVTIPAGEFMRIPYTVV